MIQRLRLLGDLVHIGAIVVFLLVVGIKGNASGMSLKSQWLYLMVFLCRYIDLLFTFYSVYNTVMKFFFIASTIATIYIMTQTEPAKSTYTPSMDTFPATPLVIASLLSGMVIHLVGSGAVNIRGSSGQEFAVHFEHMSFLSWLWTCSLVLEPLAFVPQLYIFRKHRLIHRDIRFGIFLMGMYRVFYMLFWVFRARKQVEEGEFQHHYLLYITGGLQILTYADFFFYHWSVSMLWFITRCGGVMGDSSSLVVDTGMETWALTASGGDRNDHDSAIKSRKENKSIWEPGDSPGKGSIEMKRAGGMGVV